MSDKQDKVNVRVGLYLREVREYGFYHVRLDPVTIGPDAYEQRLLVSDPDRKHIPHDRVRWFRSSLYEKQHGLWLHNLQIDSQGCDTDLPRRLYGFEVKYAAMHSVDRGEAEAMAHTLTTIEKRMAKLDAKYGRATTFGSYVARVAAAIGAKTILRASPNTRNTGELDRDQHQFMDLGQAVYSIDRLVAEWMEPTTQPAAAVCA